MHKILLTLTLAFAFIGANAQCTPDPQYTIAGIYPDSAVGLPDALVGQAYNEVITIITPLDTAIVFSGIPLTVDIIDVTLDSVNGLPANFTYDCAAPNCIFLGGSTTCAELYSTINPTVADIGLYQLFLHTTTTVDAGIFGIQTQNDIIDYYYIDITSPIATPSWDCDGQWNCSDPGTGNGTYASLSSCQSSCIAPATWDCISVGNCQDPGNGTGTYASIVACQNACVATAVFDQFDEFTFQMKEIFPNPVNNNAKIQFISGNSSDVVFTVFNHLGEKIEEIDIAATRGINNIEISANDYANGMYLYSINNGVKIVSKRMIVAN